MLVAHCDSRDLKDGTIPVWTKGLEDELLSEIRLDREYKYSNLKEIEEFFDGSSSSKDFSMLSSRDKEACRNMDLKQCLEALENLGSDFLRESKDQAFRRAIAARVNAVKNCWRKSFDWYKKKVNEEPALDQESGQRRKREVDNDEDVSQGFEDKCDG